MTKEELTCMVAGQVAAGSIATAAQAATHDVQMRFHTEVIADGAVGLAERIVELVYRNAAEREATERDGVQNWPSRSLPAINILVEAGGLKWSIDSYGMHSISGPGPVQLTNRSAVRVFVLEGNHRLALPPDGQVILSGGPAPRSISIYAPVPLRMPEHQVESPARVREEPGPVNKVVDELARVQADLARVGCEEHHDELSDAALDAERDGLDADLVAATDPEPGA